MCLDGVTVMRHVPQRQSLRRLGPGEVLLMPFAWELDPVQLQQGQPIHYSVLKRQFLSKSADNLES